MARFHRANLVEREPQAGKLLETGSVSGVHRVNITAIISNDSNDSKWKNGKQLDRPFVLNAQHVD